MSLSQIYLEKTVSNKCSDSFDMFRNKLSNLIDQIVKIQVFKLELIVDLLKTFE